MNVVEAMALWFTFKFHASTVVGTAGVIIAVLVRRILVKSNSMKKLKGTTCPRDRGLSRFYICLFACGCLLLSASLLLANLCKVIRAANSFYPERP